VAYIGNDLQVAYPTYKVIDDISSSFNGSTTSFSLLVSGSAPAPLPLNSQQCLISVAGVVQRPDDTGTEGFRLSGGNIVFSSAPATGADFFGVVLAGADYVNAGGTFPDGSAAVPSITFSDDTDTGIYRSGSGGIGFTSNGVNIGTLPSSAGSADQVLSTNGTGTLSFVDRGRMVLETAKASTSGTSVDFTGIPSWAKRITVMFSGVSTNGTSNPIVQLGTSSGLTSSGYVGTGSECGSTTAATSFTAGFGIRTGVAANTVQGVLHIYCLSVTSMIWVASGVTSQPSSAFTHQIAGTVTLSGTLDRIRITTVNGTDTFDAGSINILYEG
jgi:hypothetical protein